MRGFSLFRCVRLAATMVVCGAVQAGAPVAVVESFEWFPEFAPAGLLGPFFVNNFGEFVGRRSSGGIFTYIDGFVNDAAPALCAGTLFQTPRAINDNGVVVGYAACQDGVQSYDRGFVVEPQGVVALGSDNAEWNGFSRSGLFHQGTIVGRFFNLSSHPASNHGFRIDNGLTSVLDELFRPEGIDDSGRVYGTNINGAPGFFAKQGGGPLVNLGTFGGTGFYRINRVSGTGDFAGKLQIGSVGKPFVYFQGVGQVLPNVPGATFGEAYAVTLDGKVIGRDQNAPSFDTQNWVMNGQQRIFMPELLEPFLGFRPTIFSIVAASEEGWILGFGREPVSNGSRLFRCKIEVDLPDLDTDEDGLRDDWELDGIPYLDSKGEQQRLVLPGADPGRKDVFVEIDAGIIPLSAASASMVIDAFAQAPVPNPDGTMGVTLHLLQDEVNLVLEGVVSDPKNFPDDFAPTKEAHFGTALERADPDAEALLVAKALAYRYCLVYDGLEFPMDALGYAGIADLHGSNLMLDITAARPASADEDAAAIFMHELGHSLGIDHGGGDPVQGKPNYFSIMNYALSYRLPYSAPYWRLDYSREELAPIDEAVLDEAAGIDSTLYRGAQMPFGVGPLEDRSFRLVKLSGAPTDFDDSGMVFGLTIQDLNFIGPDAMINGVGTPSPDQELLGHDDWANLRYDIPQGALRQIAQGCPNEESIAFLEKAVPMPCFADLNADGQIGFADLNAVIGRFNAAEGEPLYDAAADVDLDGFIGFADLNEILGQFNQPCP